MMLPAPAYGLYLTGVGTVPTNRRRPIPSYYTDRYGFRPPSQVIYRAPGKGGLLWR
jgi:hypothetical protein